MVENENEFYGNLVLRWAPIDYQYIRLNTNSNYDIKKDLVVPVDLQYYKNNEVDLESRWDTSNIRERLREIEIEQLKPVVYYYIAETESHYYILYSFYHADDDTHPNDMEGCLVILEKQENSQLLLGIITVAHYDFWRYAYKDNLLHESGKEFTEEEQVEVDEELDSNRPLIQQEKGKHGLYALGPKINIGTKILLWFYSLLNIHSDVIVFYPNKEAFCYSIESIKKGKNTPYNPSFYYDLVNILDPQEGLGNYGRIDQIQPLTKMENFMVVQQIPHGYGEKGIDLAQRGERSEKCGTIRQNLYLNYLDQDAIGDHLVSNISEKWMEHDPKNRVRWMNSH